MASIAKDFSPTTDQKISNTVISTLLPAQIVSVVTIEADVVAKMSTKAKNLRAAVQSNRGSPSPIVSILFFFANLFDGNKNCKTLLMLTYLFFIFNLCVVSTKAV